MATLKIDLQAGFDDDDVRVKLDGRDVMARHSVTTDYSIGLAASDEHADVDPGDHELEISVPSRSITRRVIITVAGDTYAAVATDGADVTVTTQAEPFRYL